MYLPAIAGHVPAEIVRTLSAFLEFCYLVRRDALDEDDLDAIDAALARFHARAGRKVRVFKTGADYLDPMLHEHASGQLRGCWSLKTK